MHMQWSPLLQAIFVLAISSKQMQQTRGIIGAAMMAANDWQIESVLRRDQQS
jgi:hypothetical protein